jgi:hypothetical protein
MPQMKKHAFQAVTAANGAETVLITFTVTRKRNADSAYAAAEAACEKVRAWPHRPAAFVREINAKVQS